MTIDWNRELVDQLDWHWRYHVRPRFDGLTDDEYFWEPVPGCWSVRRRGPGAAALTDGGGEYFLEYVKPEPSPPPVTTIAWRLGHLLAVFRERTAKHFGGAPWRSDTHAYAGTAEEALRQVDTAYHAWITGVRELGADGLLRPCGPAEGPYAEAPLAALVLHINREAIHHSAEVLVLRDLYRNR